MHLVWIFLAFAMLFQITLANEYVYNGSAACDPADPMPLKTISLEQITGSWRRIYCILPKRHRLSMTLSSFDLIISNSFGNGSADVEFRGRLIDTCGCVNTYVRLEPINKPNTFKQIPVSSDILGFLFEWRFLDKIGNYMLATNCFEVDEYKRCKSFFGNVFSKSNELISLDILKRLNQSARKTLCLDLFEDFMEWPTGEACPAV